MKYKKFCKNSWKGKKSKYYLNGKGSSKNFGCKQTFNYVYSNSHHAIEIKFGRIKKCRILRVYLFKNIQEIEDKNLFNRNVYVFFSKTCIDVLQNLCGHGLFRVTKY